MTPEQQKYLDNLDLLFIQPGWVDLVETFRGYKEALTAQAFSYVKMEDYFFAKGRMDSFNQILTFQETVDGLRQSIAEQDKEKEDDA